MMRYLSILILFTILSCNTSIPELKNIDLSKWKQDVSGCKNHRLKQVEDLLQQKEVIRGLSQTQVKKLLGKPDQHELFERSQKFFIYHLETGNQCAAYKGGYFKALYIRFNSLDQAIEFTIQEIK